MSRFSVLFLILFSTLYSGISSAQTSAENNEVADAATSAPVAPATPALDRSLKPQATDEVSSLFENIVAVQRKARVKNGKFLFNPSLSFDFSDSPYTMYGLNLGFGYALGEFWEFYAMITPAYVTNERSLTSKIKDLQLPNNQAAEVLVQKAKYSYGIDVNWVPIYGKDSWGPYGIIRSDTFLNFGVSNINYDQSNGLATKLMLGKTFFISNWFNLRLKAGASYLQTVTASDKKEGVFIGLLEGGLVYYF